MGEDRSSAEWDRLAEESERAAASSYPQMSIVERAWARRAGEAEREAARLMILVEALASKRLVEVLASGASGASGASRAGEAERAVARISRHKQQDHARSWLVKARRRGQHLSALAAKLAAWREALTDALHGCGVRWDEIDPEYDRLSGYPPGVFPRHLTALAAVLAARASSAAATPARCDCAPACATAGEVCPCDGCACHEAVLPPPGVR